MVKAFHSNWTRPFFTLNKDKEYFIEDLNSKNGTWLNGEVLNYKTSYPLKKNDKICFADEEYVFS